MNVTKTFFSFDGAFIIYPSAEARKEVHNHNNGGGKGKEGNPWAIVKWKKIGDEEENSYGHNFQEEKCYWFLN